MCNEVEGSSNSKQDMYVCMYAVSLAYSLVHFCGESFTSWILFEDEVEGCATLSVTFACMPANLLTMWLQKNVCCETT